MNRAPDELLDAITQTKHLIAQAEQQLQHAHSESKHTYMPKVGYLLQDIHTLHTQILSLDADINREAIEHSTLMNYSPDNWMGRN
jgi:hypothetical protein